MPAEIPLIVLLALMDSLSVNVVVELSVVFVLKYFTNSVSGSPVAESATEYPTT